MEKIWFKSYPAATPHEIDPNTFSSIVELFERSCERFRDLPAITNFGSSLTYAELDAKSRHLAAFFQQQLGLKKGDRIALMLPNSIQTIVCLFGVLRAGLVIVNVNPLFTGRELTYQLNDAQAETIIVLSNFAHVVQEVIPETSLKHVIVTSLGDLLGFPKSLITNFTVKYIKKKVPPWKIPTAIRLKHALKRGKQSTFERVDVQGDDLAFLQYTGGTTGRSKGAMLTHRNMVANVLQSMALVEEELEEGVEVMVVALPLYHIFSLTVCCLCLTKLGGCGILITNPRDLPAFIDTLAKTTFTVFVGVNTLFNAMMHNSGFKRIDFSHLKMTIAGGMAVQSTVAEKWRVATGCWIMEGYGLTEASPVVTINPPALKVFSGSAGLPVPSMDIVIRNDDNEDMGIGEEGELCIKGPQVMQGYWHGDEQNKVAFTEDGWLRTGDIAFINEKGYIYLVDRKKDMIVVSGFNVYPNEVEDVIASHPGVKEVAVVGVQSPRAGEVVKAFIVKKNETLTKEAISAYCRRRLAPYKVPKRVVFRDRLPKSDVGKILRRLLKEEG